MRAGIFTAAHIHRLMATGPTLLTTEPTLFNESALRWIEEKSEEYITGIPTHQPADADTSWNDTHKQNALLYFEMTSGKQTLHLTGASYRFFNYTDLSGCCPDGLLLLENSIVHVTCPLQTTSHLAMQTIDTGKPTLSKSKIKAARQAWLKTNRYAHYVRCQFELMCTAATRCYYVSYDPRPENAWNHMAVIELLADAPLQEDIAERIACASAILKAAIEQTPTAYPLL